MSRAVKEDWPGTIVVWCVLVPALLWMSFIWERCTGLTFVFSKSTRTLGANSSPEHLSRTLIAAIVATVLCGALGWIVSRGRRRG